MHFTTVAVSAISFLAASASAAVAAPRQAPPPEPVKANQVFKLIALRSGSDVHLRFANAADSSLWLKLDNQNASCDKPSDGDAQFFLDAEGNMFLERRSATPQQMWTDLSGMGQGVLGYTTGAQPLPSRYAQRGPFTLDQYNDLSVNNGDGFLACPMNGAYRLWAASGNNSPGGSQNCTGISLRAAPVAEPNSCLYTS